MSADFLLALANSADYDSCMNNTTMFCPIGETLFIDQTTRTVFEDLDGRQFVIDADGEHVYGVWFSIAEPAIVPIEAAP
jgi:hypothetical protein